MQAFIADDAAAIAKRMREIKDEDLWAGIDADAAKSQWFLLLSRTHEQDLTVRWSEVGDPASYDTWNG